MSRPVSERASPRPVVGRRRSVGILGGTFDPIHLGHLAVAEEVRERLGLERILFIPAGRPPHKPDRPIASAADRAAMVGLAIAGNPAFELSRVEVDRPGPSYAVDTLASLTAEAERRGEATDFTFILSAEAFAELGSWREPRRLLSLCRLAVVPRGGRPDPGRDWFGRDEPTLAGRVTFVDGPGLAISSTAIRERVRTGRSIRYLVPDAVIAYIGDHGLYAADPAARPAAAAGSMPASASEPTANRTRTDRP